MANQDSLETVAKPYLDDYSDEIPSTLFEGHPYDKLALAGVVVGRYDQPRDGRESLVIIW